MDMFYYSPSVTLRDNKPDLWTHPVLGRHYSIGIHEDVWAARASSVLSPSESKEWAVVDGDYLTIINAAGTPPHEITVVLTEYNDLKVTLGDKDVLYPIPAAADSECVNVEYFHGLLEITIPPRSEMFFHVVDTST